MCLRIYGIYGLETTIKPILKSKHKCQKICDKNFALLKQWGDRVAREERINVGP
jgi:hypothetical protein